jgi:hypothetical protein
MRTKFWFGLAILICGPVVLAIAYFLGLITNLTSTIDEIMITVIAVMLISGATLRRERSKVRALPKRLITGLKAVGTQWSILVSSYVGLSLLIPTANQAYYDEYLAPIIEPHRTQPMTFGYGVAVGIIVCVFSLFSTLACLAVIGLQRRERSKIALWIGLLIIIIAFGVGLAEALLIPAMSGLFNLSFFWLTAVIAGFGTYFHFDYAPRGVEYSPTKFSITELKMMHSERLELFRTMAWVGVIFLTGLILSAILTFPEKFAAGSVERQYAQTTNLLTLVDVCYGILGYVVLCLGALLESLQWIRSETRHAEMNPNKEQQNLEIA